MLFWDRTNKTKDDENKILKNKALHLFQKVQREQK